MQIVNKYKELLLEWFYYNSKDGTVRRAKDGYHGRYKKDDIVQPYRLCSHGYSGVHIPTTRTTIPYHHLVLVLNHINIPDNAVIDHIDGNTNNNIISNLRVTTQQINCKNKKRRVDNSTGTTGISKSGNSFIVRKQISGKRIYLGSRPSLEEAIQLLDSYKEIVKSDGYTERHGK